MNKIIAEDIQNILSEPLPWHEFDGKTVLITGAAGMIASYFVYAFMELDNVKVIANARDANKAEKKFGQYKDNLRFSMLVQDISKPIPADLNADIIIHAASPTGVNLNDFVGTIAANIEGAKNICEYALHKKAEHGADTRVLFLSSVAIYGVTGKSDISESDYGIVDLDNKFSVYAESKRMSETIFKAYARQFGVKTWIARLASTYGPDFTENNHLAHAQFIKQANESETILLDSDGSVIRPYTYVTDTVVGCLTALLRGETGEAYNVSNPYCDVKIIDLANIIANSFHEKPIRVIANAKDPQSAVHNDTKVISIDAGKLIALGWQPKVDLKNGFARTVQSFIAADVEQNSSLSLSLSLSRSLLMECARTRQTVRRRRTLNENAAVFGGD
ncbi:MAG: NAD(P)-dependent oxidoreductase [Helicobacteraceae bacterium]|jgi:nucleoside-diphosphate-sugar epimerase|nr:NAD(P)-dependent oxidoreductase [Helicobacteraceae bacterium]